MVAYKLFRLRKDGSLGSLFINRKERIPIGKWLPAENHPTKGYTLRPRWHVTSKPVAPHLSEKDRIWMKISIKDYIELPRPEHLGGMWLLANWIKVIEPVEY